MRKGIITKEKLLKKFAKNPNISLGQLAAEFGVSRQAVSQAVSRFGLDKYKKEVIRYDVTNEEIKAYLDEHPHESYAKCAEALGISESCMANRARRLGVTRADKLQRDKKKIISLFRKGLSLTEIADSTHHSANSVSNIVVEAGLKEKSGPKIDMKKLKFLLAKKNIPSNRELADMFDVSIYAIAKAKERLRKPKKPAEKPDFSRRADETEIIRLRKENPEAKMKDIVEMSGFCSGVVTRILRRAGLLQGHSVKFDHKEAIAAYKKGESTKNLAERYGVSQGAIARVLCREPDWAEIRHHAEKVDKKAFEKYCRKNKKKTNQKIADYFGISLTRVYQIKHELGLCKNQQNTDERFKEMRAIGMSFTEIAKTIGCSISTVSRKCAKAAK